MSGTSLAVSIAGIRIALHGSDILLSALDSSRYEDFRCDTDRPDVQLYIHDTPVPFPEGELTESNRIFDSGTVWSLYRSPDGIRLLLRSPAHGGAPYRMASFDTGLSRGEIVTFLGPGAKLPLEERDPLEFPLSEVLMVCLLARGRGVMVHACGLEHEGRGLLFPGNSTDGKSTMAGLWKNQARILNDDRIILRKSDVGVRMYGTPWHGDMSDVSAQGVRLSSVSFLFHGSENELRPVSGAGAVSMLLKRSFLPLWSRSGMEFSLDLCRSIAGEVPFRELRFMPDRSVVEFLKCRS